MAKPKSTGTTNIQAAIEQLISAISERHPAPEPLLILGIANGGIELARRLALGLSRGSPPAFGRARAGVLDISFHRDDIGRHPIPKEFSPTQIPGDVNGTTVIIADDVLFSGRTVKAALDELFDHGRPRLVELAVLADRGGRILPIEPRYCGLRLSVGPRERVVVRLDPMDPRRDRIDVTPGNAAPILQPAAQSAESNPPRRSKTREREGRARRRAA